ncbi:MAG: putative hydrophobic protein (TIGR00271 family), partial [Flavobacteriaceae bacterium]
MDTIDKNTNDKNSVTEEKEFDQVKESAWQGLSLFFKELLDISEETDREATIEGVKKDISFKGHNAWILIFSIFVASIGLNVSSTAVVIGAMLISPLMGPIVGLGLSVAINDVETLKKSLINLGVMVALSVITAYLYFTISPLTKETPELLARTYPTILDVLIAIFGGLALIVAKTKKGTMASVIFGVAIATALMPPLCTVGYGLAVGNLQFAGGAIYLFSINAVFIALTTFLIAKILRFPMVKYANSKRRKR